MTVPAAADRPLRTTLPTAGVEVRLVVVDAASVRDAEPLLDATERARAGRFQRRSDHDRFVVARGTVRRALARRLGLAPASVPIRHGAYGRPQLARGGPDFNLSHAAELVATALSPTGRVGVDIEQVRMVRARHALIELTCAPHERAWLQTLAPSDRRNALFELWTAKEACLKAVGCGLAEPPAAVAVALDAEARRLPARTAADFAGRTLTVDRLPCPSGYRGALATLTE